METRHIICVDSVDGNGDTVVIDVRNAPDNIQLFGCHGEDPYVTSIKRRNLGKLKHKFKGSDDEWAIILSHFLLQKQPDQKQTGLLDDVRMLYTIKGNGLELSIRQDIQGIKVSGLKHLQDAIMTKSSRSHWVKSFCPKMKNLSSIPSNGHKLPLKRMLKTLKELADLKARVSSEQDTIAKLNAQLEDFIKAKNETENAMLQQFMGLLNEKKKKIRDQSRLLAGASVDKSTGRFSSSNMIDQSDLDGASAVQSTRASSKPRKAGASRTSKRKASAQQADPAAKVESDSDKMEVDQFQNDEPDSEEEAPEPATPDRSDDETEGEDDVSIPQVKDKSSDAVRSSSLAKASKENDPGSQGVPPPRTLPFGRRAAKTKEVADEDDETDDEEL